MRTYLLGADGGGTKTAVVLTDLSLNPVLQLRFPRSNPGDVGFDTSVRLVTECFEETVRQAGVDKSEIAAVFAGIAGASVKGYSEALTASLQTSFPGASCGASHDGINVLYAAFPEGDGVCVICGTGSSCFVKKGGQIFRIGGCGQFDLRGNGYEIGKAAFAHVFRAMDGRDESGYLADTLNARFNGCCHDHIMEINGYSKDQFAAFAPLVFEASQKGDAAARKIVEDNLSYIVELIECAGRYLNGAAFRVALSGGVARDPYSRAFLAKRVPAQATLLYPDTHPCVGAAAKAKAILSGDEPIPKSVFPK